MKRLTIYEQTIVFGFRNTALEIRELQNDQEQIVTSYIKIVSIISY